MDEMLDMFADETNEIIDQLNTNLMRLENDPENTEIINELFRHAHTMKGMSSAMGFTSVAKLTHEMEDLMDRIRSGQEKVTPEKVDILLECTELIEQISSDYINEGNSDVNITDMVSKLTGQQAPTETTTEEEVVNQNESTSVQANELELSNSNIEGDFLEVTLNMDPSIQIPSLRAFIFLNKLNELDLYVDSTPTIEECKDDTLFNGKVTLISKGTEEQLTDLINKEYIFESFTFKSKSNDVQDQNTDVENKDAENKENTANKKKATADKNNKQQSVRIQSEKIDTIINLVAELVIEKNKLELLAAQSKSEDFKEPIERLDRIISHLQEIAMNVRMVPVSNTFKLFPKEIRKTSKELNKQVDLEIIGEDTELDRSIVDHIKDPLIHIIRNSLDHGLETTEDRIKKGKKPEGSIKIIARYEGNMVIIEVSDDGKGIDGNFIAEKALQKGIIKEEELKTLTMKEKVNLICAPGFSTAEKVTSLSGRGVGLDAVKNFIEDINGTLEIDTVVGEGTTFRLYLPLTLGIIQAMLVRSGEDRFAIPLFDIETLIDRSEAELSVSNSKEILIYKGRTYPIVHLSNVVCEKGEEPTDNHEQFAILVKKGNKNFALMVNDIVGQQEIVIKSLGEALKNVKEYSGATILGDGYVCLILDVVNLS